MKTKTTSTNSKQVTYAFVDYNEDSIKRLGYAIYALVAYDVFFTLIVLGIFKVNGII